MRANKFKNNLSEATLAPVERWITDGESMDVVFLSQALHHANKPLKLLLEIDGVTRSRGMIILAGEKLFWIHFSVAKDGLFTCKKPKISQELFTSVPTF